MNSGRFEGTENRPILIIDDDAEYSEMVTSALNALGFAVLAAQNGLKGIEVARVAQPGVILLDMIMPDMDGISTCERLKRDPVLCDIPVVGITGSLDLTLVEKAYAAGAQFFLPKPFTAEALAYVMRLATEETQSGPSHRDPGFTVELPARCRVRGNAERIRHVAGIACNVSLGGVLVLLFSETVNRGTLLSLELWLPEGPIAADGTVIWQDSQPKDDGRIAHGIQLLRFAEDGDLIRFTRFISQIAANNDGKKKS